MWKKGKASVNVHLVVVVLHNNNYWIQKENKQTIHLQTKDHAMNIGSLIFGSIIHLIKNIFFPSFNPLVHKLFPSGPPHHFQYTQTNEKQFSFVDIGSSRGIFIPPFFIIHVIQRNKQ